MIEGFLYPFRGVGPIDFEVTAPAPASMILFIEEKDTPRIPEAKMIGDFKCKPAKLISIDIFYKNIMIIVI